MPLLKTWKAVLTSGGAETIASSSASVPVRRWPGTRANANTKIVHPIRDSHPDQLIMLPNGVQNADDCCAST